MNIPYSRIPTGRPGELGYDREVRGIRWGYKRGYVEGYAVGVLTGAICIPLGIVIAHWWFL